MLDVFPCSVPRNSYLSMAPPCKRLLGFVLEKNLQKRSETLWQQNKILMILDSVTSRPRAHLFNQSVPAAYETV